MQQSTLTENQIEAYIEGMKPYWHRTVNMGINKFKKHVAGQPKSVRNALIARYKERAWMTARGLTRLKGSTPTHPKYGKDIEVNHLGGEESIDVKRS